MNYCPVCGKGTVLKLGLYECPNCGRVYAEKVTSWKKRIIINEITPDSQIFFQCQGCVHHLEPTSEHAEGCMLHSGHGIENPCPDHTQFNGEKRKQT